MSNITILRLISTFYQVNTIHFLNQEANLKNIFYIITKEKVSSTHQKYVCSLIFCGLDMTVCM